jgi:cbb3-type cytochrome oxidase subunit 3
MNAGEIGFLLFGLALVVLFAAVIVHFYSRKRKTQVEQAKYKMLDDD